MRIVPPLLALLALAACGGQPAPVGNRSDQQKAEIENKAHGYEAEVENEVGAEEARLDNEARQLLADNQSKAADANAAQANVAR